MGDSSTIEPPSY